MTLKSGETLTSRQRSMVAWPCSASRESYLEQVEVEVQVQVQVQVQHLLPGMRSRPSSRCISLFSSRLFSTGSTFLSTFSIPSSTNTLARGSGEQVSR